MEKILFTLFLLNILFAFSQSAEKYLQQGDYVKAINILENKSGKTEQDYLTIARIYEQTGNLNKEIDTYKKALMLNNTVFTKLKLAKALSKTEDKQKAIQLYQEILNKNPDNLIVKYRLATLYLTNKEDKKALPVLLELTQKDTTNINYLYKLGLIYNRLKQKDKAVVAFKKILKTDSLNIKAIYRLAKLYRIKKNKDSTLFFLKKGLRIKPNYIPLNQLQVKNAFANRDYKTVINTVKHLDSLNNSTSFYKNLLGISYYQTNEYIKAKNVLTKLFQKKQVQDNTFYYLGLIHQKLKEYDIAKMYFNLSIYSKRPKIDKEYYQIAMIYKAQNKLKKAILFLKKSLKENSYSPDTLYELGFLSENYYKDKTIALEYYNKYISHFESLNPKRTKYVLQQTSKIKTDLFMNK